MAKKSKKEKPLPSLPKETSLYSDVWEVVRHIPAGRVTNYGAIAKYLGTHWSARMVGWAMGNAGSTNVPIPAHRVVNRIGQLTAKHQFSTDTAMQKMLEKDGLEVKDDKVVNFEAAFWDPAKELGL